MRTEGSIEGCANPNFFSDVVQPAVDKRLPERGGIGDKVVNHLTGVRTYVDTVARDLCDDERMGKESAKSMVGFISRTSATVAVSAASVVVGGFAIAAGAPVLATVGVAAVGLAVAAPFAEKIALGVGSFAGEILAGIRGRE
jgi:hypothetical protein